MFRGITSSLSSNADAEFVAILIPQIEFKLKLALGLGNRWMLFYSSVDMLETMAQREYCVFAPGKIVNVGIPRQGKTDNHASSSGNHNPSTTNC